MRYLLCASELGAALGLGMKTDCMTVVRFRMKRPRAVTPRLRLQHATRCEWEASVTYLDGTDLSMAADESSRLVWDATQTRMRGRNTLATSERNSSQQAT